MTKTETLKILAILTPNYRRDLRDDAEVEAIAQSWATWFSEDSAKVVWEAVVAHVNDKDKGRFFPTVADIRDKMPERVLRLTAESYNDEIPFYRMLKEARQKGYRTVAAMLAHEGRGKAGT